MSWKTWAAYGIQGSIMAIISWKLWEYFMETGTHPALAIIFMILIIFGMLFSVILYDAWRSSLK